MKNILELVRPYIGAKIWSLMHGYVTVIRVDSPSQNCPIEVMDKEGYTHTFSVYGCYYEDGEDCLLFPSKECRDWDKPFDLPIDTPVMFLDGYDYWSFGYYSGNGRVYHACKKSIDVTDEMQSTKWDSIVPFDKFNPNDVEASLEFDICKYLSE